ncbi:MAG: TIGR03663 family protein [Pyrinomonadaceae bacterium]|nr:TIGR03663 family protein [Pyrinomonadaceae bacterium]
MNDSSVISERAWRGASLGILLVAAILRFFWLDLKPLHHDESVNGFFLARLLHEGIYQYDPANYHGPTLYYFALPFASLLGLNTFALRLVTVLSGLGCVWLILQLRRRIGEVGALAAAALVAVSPGAVYLSRYLIHEALFLFFTLGIVVAAERFSNRWRQRDLLLASLCAALLFATKETAFISAGVLILATVLAWSLTGFVRQRTQAQAKFAVEKNDKRRRQSAKPARFTMSEEAPWLLARCGGWSRLLPLLGAALGVFIFVNILFYSSFFQHGKGVTDALETFKVWARTGTSDFHRKPLDTYLWWLLQEEAPLLALGVLGAVLAVIRANNRFALFVALWAFGLLAAYSLVPYKTPWLMLNFIVPLAIIGGYGVDVLYRKKIALKRAALALTGVAVAIGTYQTIALNFFHYDDDRYPYVYAHTRREFLELVRDINRIAERVGTKTETSIAVASPDYWPLPWYLRDYKRVGYHGRVGTHNEAMVIGSSTQGNELKAALGDRYRQISSRTLRPGVELVLYVRRDL